MCLIAAFLLTAFHGGDCFPHMRSDYVDEKTASLPMNTADVDYAPLHRQTFMNEQPR